MTMTFSVEAVAVFACGLAMLLGFSHLAAFFAGALRGARVLKSPRMSPHKWTVEYLRRNYSDEFPEIMPVATDEQNKKLIELVAEREWCLNVLGSNPTDEGQIERMRTRHAEIEREIEEITRSMQ